MSMPPRYGTRKNSKTGKIETYELPTPIDIEISRKQFRDFLQGNYQWHDDPYTNVRSSTKKEEEENVTTDDQEVDFVVGCYGY